MIFPTTSSASWRTMRRRLILADVGGAREPQSSVAPSLRPTARAYRATVRRRCGVRWEAPRCSEAWRRARSRESRQARVDCPERPAHSPLVPVAGRVGHCRTRPGIGVMGSLVQASRNCSTYSRHGHCARCTTTMLKLGCLSRIRVAELAKRRS